MKGLFTATLLDRLARRHPALLANVDLLAGTSTGGIIALGVADGKTPAALAALYRNEGARIFDDSLWDDLKDLGDATGADYGNGELKTVLRREFGAGRRLRQLAKRVLIPSFDLDAPARRGRPRMWKPKFFHNYPGPDSDGGELIVDVALATTAAPTFFPSYRGYVDGGVVANNPSLAAVALALDPRGGGRAPGDLVVLSVGTGIEPKFIHGDVDWGWGQWARPLVSLMITGVMGVADFQCRQLLDHRYLRLDGVFGHAVNLDDTRPATLSYLEARARAVDLREALRWLGQVGW